MNILPCKQCIVDPMCMEPCNKFTYEGITNFEFFMNHPLRYNRLIESFKLNGIASHRFKISKNIKINIMPKSFVINYYFSGKAPYNVRNKNTSVVHNIVGIRFRSFRPGKRSVRYMTNCDSFMANTFDKTTQSVNCKRCLMFMSGKNKAKKRWYDL